MTWIPVALTWTNLDRNRHDDGTPMHNELARQTIHVREGKGQQLHMRPFTWRALDAKDVAAAGIREVPDRVSAAEDDRPSLLSRNGPDAVRPGSEWLTVDPHVMREGDVCGRVSTWSPLAPPGDERAEQLATARTGPA